MSLILNIETATQTCSIGLSDAGRIIAVRESSEKNIHAAKVSIFSEEVCREARVKMHELKAVSVSMGPGSYTGLRIGVSSAKGFCYALDIPLIAVPTLQSMALIAANTRKDSALPVPDNLLLCPIIDARRMEVYTALYDMENHEVRQTEALIIDENSFDDELGDHSIMFFGDGAMKCRGILEQKGMIYLEGIIPSAASLALIAHEKFMAGKVEDLAYFEPYYLKDFIAGKPRVKGLN